MLGLEDNGCRTEPVVVDVVNFHEYFKRRWITPTFGIKTETNYANSTTAVVITTRWMKCATCAVNHIRSAGAEFKTE